MNASSLHEKDANHSSFSGPLYNDKSISVCWFVDVHTVHRDEVMGSQLCREGEQKHKAMASFSQGMCEAALLPALSCIFVQLKHEVRGGFKGLRHC